MEISVLLLIVGALIVGSWLFGTALHLAGAIITGLIIGAIARLVLPGRQNISLLMTAAYGLAGSLAGDFLARWLGFGGLLRIAVEIGIAALLVAGSSQRRLQGPQ